MHLKKQNGGKSQIDYSGSDYVVSQKREGIKMFSSVEEDDGTDFDISQASDAIDRGIAQISLNKYGKVKLQADGTVERDYQPVSVAKARKFMHDKEQAWSVCTKKFTTQGEKTDAWSICTKGFSIRGEPSLVCQVCRKYFLSENDLKLHRTVHTQEELYKCSQCDKPYRDKRSLKLHEQSHKSQRSFLCNVCSKGFPDGDTFKAHVKLHSSVKPLTNSVFCKKFSEKGMTKRHLVFHSEEKPFICTTCGLSFKQKQQLIKHIKTHSTNTCKICQQVFKSDAKLKKHMTFHTCESQYVCHVCSLGFNTAASLENHMASNTCRKTSLGECSKDSGIDFAEDIGPTGSHVDKSEIEESDFNIGKLSCLEDCTSKVENLVVNLQESSLADTEPIGYVVKDLTADIKDEVVVEEFPLYVKEEIPDNRSTFGSNLENKFLICNAVNSGNSNIITLIIDKHHIQSINEGFLS